MATYELGVSYKNGWGTNKDAIAAKEVSRPGDQERVATGRCGLRLSCRPCPTRPRPCFCLSLDGGLQVADSGTDGSTSKPRRTSATQVSDEFLRPTRQAATGDHSSPLTAPLQTR
jgi:hypothetical protein